MNNNQKTNQSDKTEPPPPMPITDEEQEVREEVPSPILMEVRADQGTVPSPILMEVRADQGTISTAPEEEPPENESPKINPPEDRDVVAALLVNYPELASRLRWALETKRFFVTINAQVGDGRKGGDDLKHWWLNHGYPEVDVKPTLIVVVNDYIDKTFPDKIPDTVGGKMR
jgi:hypothetical protein